MKYTIDITINLPPERVINFFHEVDSNTTKWVCESEFQCSRFMKLFALLLPGSFKKETVKFLEYFKSFAEKKYR